MLTGVLSFGRRHQALALAAWIGLLAAVSWLSLSPRVHVPGPEGTDKLAHLAAYAALAAWPVAMFTPWRGALISAMTTPLLGVLLEIGQTMVPGRSGELADAAANCLGTLIGVVVACRVRPP